MANNNRHRLRSQFPEGTGCYIIRNGDQVLYVGQSRKMENRWMSHRYKEYIEDHFPNATVEVIYCDVVHLLRNEAVLIKTLNPVLNNANGRDFHKILGTNPYWWWL